MKNLLLFSLLFMGNSLLGTIATQQEQLINRLEEKACNEYLERLKLKQVSQIRALKTERDLYEKFKKLRSGAISEYRDFKKELEDLKEKHKVELIQNTIALVVAEISQQNK